MAETPATPADCTAKARGIFSRGTASAIIDSEPEVFTDSAPPVMKRQTNSEA